MTAPFMTDTTTNLACGAMCQLCGDRKTASTADHVDAWAHQHLEDIHPGPYAYLLGVLANTAIIITEADQAIAEERERADTAERKAHYYECEFVGAAHDFERTARNLRKARAELRRYRGQLPPPARLSRAASADLILKHLNTSATPTEEFRRYWLNDLVAVEDNTPSPTVWPHQC